MTQQKTLSLPTNARLEVGALFKSLVALLQGQDAVEVEARRLAHLLLRRGTCGVSDTKLDCPAMLGPFGCLQSTRTRYKRVSAGTLAIANVPFGLTWTLIAAMAVLIQAGVSVVKQHRCKATLLRVDGMHFRPKTAFNQI